MDSNQRQELIKIAWATAELMGADLSKAAAAVLVEDLAEFPYDQVVAALRRCRREAKGRLTVEAVLSRIDDGRPGPEEAWTMLPADEHQSVVWNEEIARAYGAVHALVAEDRLIEARMAFKEIYARLLSEARSDGRPPRWVLSPGRDPEGRKEAVRTALERGRLTQERALELLPDYLEEPAHDAPRLTGDRPVRAGDVAKGFDQLRKELNSNG